MTEADGQSIEQTEDARRSDFLFYANSTVHTLLTSQHCSKPEMSSLYSGAIEISHGL